VTPVVTVFAGPAHDLIHTSLVLSGLCALDRQRLARVRLRRPGPHDRWLVGDPVVVCVDIEGPVHTRVAIDLRDGEGVSEPIIDRVEWYLKRAYYPVELRRLPAAMAVKIKPFGLNYGCRSAASTWRLLPLIGLPILAQGRQGLDRLRQYFSTPPARVFEQAPDVPVKPWVTFQTRLWAPDEVPAGEVDELNDGRVAVIRALRKEFGERFIGGLVPTRFARERYPEELTPHSSRYAEYLALRKQCLIGVYTRGVEHSLAFKLGETFAAAQCLVSEPLRYGLPTPIEPGVHYLSFETPDQCVAACARLLDQPALAGSMRRANHAYYCREVEPAAHMQRVLERLTAVK
jgi:hypothetical protein